MTPSDIPAGAPIDPARYRRIMSHYPTGVCLVTAQTAEGPVAMVVGSFTSVSLDPPLVAFLPARSSATWAMLRHVSAYCISVVSAEQEDICHKIARKHPRRFADLDLVTAANGAPRLARALATIECTPENIVEAGDHDIVLCRVTALDLGEVSAPLIFFRGAYGQLAAARAADRDTRAGPST